MITEVKIMNLLAEVPDIFSGVFTTFWVFAVVIGVASLIFTILFIVLLVFIIRKAMQRNQEIIEQQQEYFDEVYKDKECEFCGTVIPSGTSERPNCGAPVKAK